MANDHRFYHSEVHTAYLVLKELDRIAPLVKAAEPLDIPSRSALEVAIAKIYRCYRTMKRCGGVPYLRAGILERLGPFEERLGNCGRDPLVPDRLLLDFWEKDAPSFRESAECVIRQAKLHGVADSGNDIVTPEQVLEEIGAKNGPGMILR